MERGVLRLPQVGGVFVGVHWSLPVSMAVVGFGSPGASAAAAWLSVPIVVAVHALGHLAVAWVRGLRVTAIDVGGLGAAPKVRGRASRGVHAQVAFGGVTAQALLGAVLALSPGLAHDLSPLAWINALLLFVNLIPAGTLDGGKGWRHLSLALQAAKRSGPSSHPAVRAMQLAQDTDRDVGHVQLLQPPAPSTEPQDAEPDVPVALAAEVDALMDAVRADFRARREGATDDPD